MTDQLTNKLTRLQTIALNAGYDAGRNHKMYGALNETAVCPYRGAGMRQAWWKGFNEAINDPVNGK